MRTNKLQCKHEKLAKRISPPNGEAKHLQQSQRAASRNSITHGMPNLWRITTTTRRKKNNNNTNTNNNSRKSNCYSNCNRVLQQQLQQPLQQQQRQRQQRLQQPLQPQQQQQERNCNSSNCNCNSSSTATATASATASATATATATATMSDNNSGMGEIICPILHPNHLKARDVHTWLWVKTQANLFWDGYPPIDPIVVFFRTSGPGLLKQDCQSFLKVFCVDFGPEPFQRGSLSELISGSVVPLDLVNPRLMPWTCVSISNQEQMLHLLGWLWLEVKISICARQQAIGRASTFMRV